MFPISRRVLKILNARIDVAADPPMARFAAQKAPQYMAAVRGSPMVTLPLYIGSSSSFQVVGTLSTVLSFTMNIRVP